MKTRMMRTAALICIAGLLSVGVLSCATPEQSRGAAAGGIFGGFTGAILDSRNPWRGGVIGALIGGAFGATLAEVSAQGAREAAYTDRSVVYRTDDGRGTYYAEPREYNPSTKCRKVQERVWEDGKLVRDDTREVCEGEKYERRY